MTRLLVILSLVLGVSACSHYGKKGHHRGGHKMWKVMDADNNGEVTRAEFDKAHGEMFKKMDANGDGKITKEEKMAFKKAKKKDKSCCK